MRNFSKGIVLEACKMSFNGTSNAKIAEHFKVTDSTVSRWRKLQIWIDFENELVDAYKAAALKDQYAYDANKGENSTRLG